MTREESDRLRKIKQTHQWVKENEKSIEFSHALDLFRDQQSDIQWLLDLLERQQGSKWDF